MTTGVEESAAESRVVHGRRPESEASAGVVAHRDEFLQACARQGIEADRAEAVWGDLTGAVGAQPRRPASRSALATVVIGAVLLSAAGIWWATLVTSAAGAPGLFGLAVAWIIAAGLAAEAARRRGVAHVDALISVIAVAYAAVAVGAAMNGLAGSSFGDHWWGRAAIESALLVAGSITVWRYAQPVVTMFAPTLGVGALALDALASSAGNKDIQDWPLWAAFAVLVLAALYTAVAVGLDHRNLRAQALWPSLLADATTVGAIVAITAVASTGSLAIGAATAAAGLTVFARGTLVGRLAQIAVGGAVFWIGVITIGSTWGDLAVAALTTLAGVSMIAGAITLNRRGDLIRRRRSPSGHSL